MTREEYQARTDSLSALGFKVVDFESYRTSSGQRYAAIWEQVPSVAWAVRTDRTLTWFLNYHHLYTDQGFRLVDFESYQTEDGTRYAGAWVENDSLYRLPFRQELDDSVESYRAQWRVPGLSVAIILQGEAIYQRGFGWADSARGEQAYSGTVFPTASVAKVLAGTIAARLEARGVVDLTRPTTDFVDSLSAGHTHTLEQLLSKTGCVIHYAEGPEPPEGYYRWRRDALVAVSDTTQLGSWMLPNCTPGQRWHYSTHGFTLLGAALEKATGKDVLQLVDEEIARPMGLRTLHYLEPTDSSATIARPPRSYHQSEPYALSQSPNGTFSSAVSRHEDASWKVFGGGLQIDAPDLARFGWFVLNGWAVSDSVRDNRLWRVLTTGIPRWNSTLATPPTALAWEVRMVNSRRVAEHGGTASTGGRSWLAVYRDDGLVVAILSNQREGPGTTSHPIDDLAHDLARIVLTPRN
jgi:CubicO group peptidase (beta-lactamase class C family)